MVLGVEKVLVHLKKKYVGGELCFLKSANSREEAGQNVRGRKGK